MIKVLIGNLFESKVRTLVNTVNCVGIMGKGVAQEFKKRYPDLFDDYARRCTDKLVKPGEPYLFKNTQQAEEVTTVFYAVRELKKELPEGNVSEQDVFDYVIKWKKSWASEEKREAIASAIRNLAMLSWVKVKFSETLPLEDVAV